jgi:hypothetical protein
LMWESWVLFHIVIMWEGFNIGIMWRGSQIEITITLVLLLDSLTRKNKKCNNWEGDFFDYVSRSVAKWRTVNPDLPPSHQICDGHIYFIFSFLKKNTLNKVSYKSQLNFSLFCPLALT